MGDVDGGDVEPTLQLFDLEAHLLPQLGIQVGERLVQQQNLGTIDQSPGQSHPLLLPAGELARVVLLVLLHADELQSLHDHLVPLGLGLFSDHQGKLHVLEDSHVGEEGKVLENHAQLPLVGGHIGHVLSVNEDLPLVGREVAGDAAQGGGLAAARRPQQGHQLAP